MGCDLLSIIGMEGRGERRGAKPRPACEKTTSGAWHLPERRGGVPSTQYRVTGSGYSVPKRQKTPTRYWVLGTRSSVLPRPVSVDPPLSKPNQSWVRLNR